MYRVYRFALGVSKVFWLFAVVFLFFLLGRGAGGLGEYSIGCRRLLGT